MNTQALTKLKLSDKPGVYFFLGSLKRSDGGSGHKREILYIGKATSLKDRVRSYFTKDVVASRGLHIENMVAEAQTVRVETTDSVLEALVLESYLIKKHKPKYNTEGKDDKSFNYVVITKENFPRVLVVRGRDLEGDLKAKSYQLQATFGPFPKGGELREAMKLIRKIFPFRDKCAPCSFPRIQGPSLGIKKGRSFGKFLPCSFADCKPCFNRQIRLCPGVCTGEISAEDYGNQIKNLKLFLSGKKKELVKNLKKEMKASAKELKFERASELKRELFALSHIQDVALMKREVVRGQMGEMFRIEAYDAAHLSGKNSVAVMTVIENGEVNKNEYRKFKLRGVDPIRNFSPQGDRSTRKLARAVSNGTGADDLASLEEVLRRRFNHLEWRMPSIVVVDGGANQKRRAEKVLKEIRISVPILAVVKDEFHRPRRILGDTALTHKYERAILLGNSEAHRFAIKYHRELRDRLFTRK